MKKSKFRVIMVCLAIAIFTSSATYGQNNEDPKPSTDKLEDEFLGLHLGCSMEELKRVLKKSPNPIRLIKKKVAAGTMTYLYSGNHRLNGAAATVFSFWDGKLMGVIVFFGSEEHQRCTMRSR